MLSSQPVFTWFSASAFKKLRRLAPTYLWPFLHSPWEPKGLPFISLLSQAMGVSSCFISSSSQEWYLHSPFPCGYEKRVAVEDRMICVRKNEGFINFIVSHLCPISNGESPQWGQQCWCFQSLLSVSFSTLHPSVAALYLPSQCSVPLQATHLLQTKPFWQTGS